jgi:NAD(P)H-quinone oxidoreductase subunit 5
VTAIFGSLVMLTQTSIKKALAFSTVAQMGYMILQCGLGAFALAALHLVAHSLYKAHAFLRSGSTVSQPTAPSLSEPAVSGRAAGPFTLPLLLVIATAMTGATAALFGISPAREPGIVVFGAILVMAVTTLMWSAWSATPGLVLRSLGIATAVCIAYFSLHHFAGWFLAGSVPSAQGPLTAAGGWIIGGILSAFFAVFLLQANLPRIQETAWGQRLYVLIFNRFYINAWVNRVVLKIWPLAKA